MVVMRFGWKKNKKCDDEEERDPAKTISKEVDKKGGGSCVCIWVEWIQHRERNL